VNTITLGPQPGPQTKFLSTTADIAIYGGAAGGGKTFALLLEPTRNYSLKGFEGVIFRRTTPQITFPGGLWDASQEIYRPLGMIPRENTLDWYKINGMAMKFAHLESEGDKYNWQGGQIAYLGFDELTHFTKSQFFYLISRNRSTTGVRGRVRATCNPDADSWVAEFLQWWWNPDTGYPIPERDGVLRWCARVGDDLVWGNSKEELSRDHGPDVGTHAKSVTFIKSDVHDNKILLEKDPGYLSNLMLQDRVERARLLDGNWLIKKGSGTYFQRSDFEIIPTMPSTGQLAKIRYWDRAATKPSVTSPNPDWTVGTKMTKMENGLFIIEHVERFRDGPLGNQKVIKNTASADGYFPAIGIEQDPGAAGVSEAHAYTILLQGYNVLLYPVHKNKELRATPYSAQVQAGNVKLLRGPWNEAFLTEHAAFPPDKKKATRKKDGADDEPTAGKDDQVDSASGAFNHLTGDIAGKWMQESKTTSQSTIVSGFLRNTDQW
jgi:predicted phage terminase large subunit-like protein